MLAKNDATYQKELGDVYRDQRRDIVRLLKEGDLGLEDAKRLAGESVFLYANRVPVDDPHFVRYQTMKAVAQANRMLEGTCVKVLAVGKGVVISTPNGRAYYDGNGRLGKIDSTLDEHR